MKAELAKERVVVTAKNKIAIGEQLCIELDHVTGHGHISRHDNRTVSQLNLLKLIDLVIWSILKKF